MQLVGLFEQLVRETLLSLETVVLTARHGECDSDARLHVNLLAKSGQSVGVDEQRVVLDVNVCVEDGECLVQPTQHQLR